MGGVFGFMIAAFLVTNALTARPKPNAILVNAPPSIAPQDPNSGAQVTDPSWYLKHDNNVSLSASGSGSAGTKGLAPGTTPPPLPKPGQSVAATGAGASENDALTGPPSGGSAIPTGGNYDVPAIGPNSLGTQGIPAGLAPQGPPQRHMVVSFVAPRDLSTAGASNATAARTPVLPTPAPDAPTLQQQATGDGSDAGRVAQERADESSASNDYLRAEVQSPRSPFELQAGSVIPAVLAGGINSDLPGTLRAVVSENVYDSINQRTLLIPYGSHLVGSYQQGTVYGQNRMFVVWNRLFFPDGRFIDIGGMASQDQQGKTGLNARVNKHTGNSIGTIALLTALQGVFSLVTAPRQPSTNGAVTVVVGAEQAPTPGQQMATSAATQLTNLATQMTQQSLSQAPTLEVEAGSRFNIAVERDIVFPGPWVSATGQ